MQHEEKKQTKGKVLAFGVFGIVAAFLLLYPLGVFGQLTIDSGLAPTFGLGSANLQDTVINIVKWALGLLGLVAVIIIIYGGFLWMTAHGDATQIEKAKRVLKQAVIGLVIILLSWAIVQFVVGSIIGGTTTGGSSTCTPGQQIGYPSCRVCDSSNNWVDDPAPADAACDDVLPSYYVRWTIPDDSPEQTDVSLCSIVAAGFDGVTPPWLNASTVNASTVTITDESGTNVALDTNFTVNPDSNAFRYKHGVEWQANHTYNVQVTSGVHSAVGDVAATLKSWAFTTGTTSDPDPPQVVSAYPSGANQCLQPKIRVTFNEPMDPVSITKDNITLEPADATVLSVFMDSSSSFIATLNKPIQGSTLYTVTLNADLATGIWDTCGNALDGNANGTAEGSPTDDYSWTFTTEDTTEVDCSPEITSISNYGEYSYDAGDVITIDGHQLATVDSVFFRNKYYNREIQVDNQDGASSKCFNTEFMPQQSTPTSSACVATTADDHIDVIVPAGGIDLGDPGNGATDGAIRVRSVDEFSNSSSDLQAVGSPHIKSISPTQGGEGQYVTISGENFTSDGAVWFKRPDGSEVRADTCDPTNSATWTDSQVVVVVPSGFSAGDNLFVQVDADILNANNGNDRSNVRSFLVTNDEPTPGICTISASCHNTAGNSITLTGEGFGTAAGLSYFQALGSNAPNIYSSSSFSTWNNNTVTLTSPSDLPNDEFNLYLETPDGRLSNSIGYEVPCGAGFEVLFNGGSCNPTIGQIPSPNPYADAQDVCPNLVRIAFAFSENVNRPSPSQHQLYRCNSGRGSCDTDFTEINTASTVGPLVGQDFNTNMFSDSAAAAGNSLREDTWYKFVILGTVTSSGTNILLGDDVSWYFKTKADATPCDADNVAIDFVSATGAFDPATNVSEGSNALSYTASLSNDATCNVVIPPTQNFQWSVDNTSIASCGAGCTTQDAQIITDAANEGTTNIRTSYLGTINDDRPLTVRQNFCTLGTPCVSTDLAGNACTSTCDVTEERCLPHINSVNPNSGPGGSATTLAGCFFGNTTGQVIFDDGTTSLEGDVNACGPIAQWQDKQVVIGVPSGFADTTVTDVTLRADYDGTLVDSDNAPKPQFTYSDSCTNGADVPPGGVPILCSLSPASGGIGNIVSFKGGRFFGGANVQFTGATADPADTTWVNSTEVQTLVPSGFQTGPAYVEVQSGPSSVCPSNPLTFQESCRRNSECATGCCDTGVHACVPAGNCSEGTTIGEACQIDNAFYSSDTTCNVGPTAPITVTGEEYRCLSDTGYNEDPGKTAVVSPSGTQCEYCCDPDQDGDSTTFDPQVSGDLICVAVPAGGGACETAGVTGRGLFCGCDPAQEGEQCGTSNGCSTQNDPTGQACCRSRPTVESVTPTTLACTNNGLVIDFSQQMDRSSINANTILITQSGAVREGKFTVLADKVYFSPTVPWIPGTAIDIVIRGNPGSVPFVKDVYGITLGSNYSPPVTPVVSAGATLCAINNIRIQWLDMNVGFIPHNPPSLFSCARDDCPEDFDSASGNQQLWVAAAYDADGNFIASAEMSLSENDPQDVFTLDPACISNPGVVTCLVTATGNNGSGNIIATADGSADNMGVKTKNGRVNAFMCQKPWPPSTYPTFPFIDTSYNFALSYCRENLPTLWIGTTADGFTSPLHKTYTATNPDIDEVLSEYVFFVSDDDGNRLGLNAIGVRVMQNTLHLPPDLWYERATGGAPPGGSMTTVDGFPAMRLGRSTYIAATNLNPNAALNGCSGPGTGCNGGIMYSNMYIISYDGDLADTQKIYDQLVKNLALTINVGDTGGTTTLIDNEKIRSDTKRAQDIFRISLLLSDYKKVRGDYPLLTAGTFLQYATTSVWPSWQEGFASALGQTLPVDAANKIVSCPYGEDNSACWDEQNRNFQAPDGSHLYQYMYPPTSAPFLFTRFDYLGPGSWINAATPPDPCVIYPGSSCPTYNYSITSAEFENIVNLYQTTGVLDTIDPTIGGYSIPTDITTSTLFTVAASDDTSGSGMSRVEFYVDGLLRYVDYTNDFEWQFNPASYADGTYQIEAKAFDNAGNYDTTGIQTVTIQKAIQDQTPPSISNFQPADNATLIGNVTLSATASDSGSGLERVEYYLNTTYIGACLSGSPCASSNYSFVWDSGTVPDGDYKLYAVAFDNSNNTAIILHNVTTDNGFDNQNPFVQITTPQDGQAVSGTVLVAAQASDNLGIASLQFDVQGTMYPPTGSFPNPDSTDPYRWAWNTYSYTDGSILTVTVTATDTNGNQSSAQVTVSVDNSSGSVPSVWFTSPFDGDVFSPGIFQVHAESPTGIDSVELFAINQSGSQQSLGQTSIGNPYQFTWDTSLPDGSYTMRAVATDPSGVSSDPGDVNANIAIIVDTQSPTLTSYSPTSGSTLTGTVPVLVTATDPNGLSYIGMFAMHASGVIGSCYPPGNPTTYTCQFDWDTTTASSITSFVLPFAVDVANNSVSEYAYNVTINNTASIDTTPPTTTIDVAGKNIVNGIWYVRGTRDIQLTGSDNVGVTDAQINLNGINLNSAGSEGVPTCTSLPCTSTWNTALDPRGSTIADGTVVPIIGTNTDAAGNSQSQTINVRVDNSAPTMTSVIDDGDSTSDGTLLHATWGAATEPHAASSADIQYAYSIGTSAGSTNVIGWTSAGNNTFVTHFGLNLTDGTTYYINVRATNGSGLQSNVVSTDGITYSSAGADTTAPTNPVITVTPTATYVSGTVQISVTSSDPESGIQSIDVYIDGTSVRNCSSSPCTYSWDTSSYSDGIRTISAVATNTVSLISNSTTYAQRIDNTDPTIVIVVPFENQNIGGSSTISAGPYDAYSGIGSVTIYHTSMQPSNIICVDTSPSGSWSCLWDTTTFCPVGNTCSVTLYASVTDGAGNSANSTTARHATINNVNPAQNCGTAICGAGESCCSLTGSTCYNTSTQYCCSGTVRSTPCTTDPCASCTGCATSKPPACCGICGGVVVDSPATGGGITD